MEKIINIPAAVGSPTRKGNVSNYIVDSFVEFIKAQPELPEYHNQFLKFEHIDDMAMCSFLGDGIARDDVQYSYDNKERHPDFHFGSFDGGIYMQRDRDFHVIINDMCYFFDLAMIYN